MTSFGLTQSPGVSSGNNDLESRMTGYDSNIASLALRMDAAENGLSNHTHAWVNITGKPTFATVSTTGNYNDLSNTPTIPAAQIQSDWSQSNNTSMAYIKNKPSVPTITQQAHINDCATNAPTNLNVVTTLLGTLVGEVNNTNAKQNDIALKLNLVFDCLEINGMLAA